ncbi:MAG: insulinase family protein [Xanthomonadaceae bacterium]|nr:insulinase family protein [Xanthomonadaceae bacterium]
MKILIVLLILSVQPCFATIPKPYVEKLPSGLTVAVFEDHKLPLIDFVLLVPHGSVNDPAMKSGTAQLMMELLDRGSGEYNAAQFADLVESKGATTYSSIDNDSMTLGIHGMSTDRDVLFDLFRKWIMSPKWDPEEFKKEKTKLLDRWGHLGDQTSLLATLGFSRRLTNKTLYARGAFMSEVELRSINLSDSIAFYQNFFKPSDSVLIIVGDVNTQTWLKPQLAKLSEWKGSVPTQPLQKFASPQFDVSKEVIIAIDKPGAPHADIKFGVPAPSFKSKEHYDLLVSNSIFGDTFSSWLNTKIRDQAGYVYSIGSSFGHSVGYSIWGVSTSTAPEQVGLVLAKISKLYKDFQATQFTEAEVTAAKGYLVGSFAVNNSTLGQVASRWLAGKLFDLPEDYLEKFTDRVNQTNFASVAKATRTHFAGKTPEIVVSCDRLKCEKTLVAAGFKRLKWLKVSDLK